MKKAINLFFILLGITIIGGGGYFTIGTLLMTESIEKATVPVVAMFIEKPTDILELNECEKITGQELIEHNSKILTEAEGLIKCTYEEGDLILYTNTLEEKVKTAKYSQEGCTDDPEALSDLQYLEMIGYPQALMQIGSRIPSSLGDLQAENSENEYLQVYKNRFMDGYVLISCVENILEITVENPADFEEAFDTEGEDLSTFFEDFKVDYQNPKNLETP